MGCPIFFYMTVAQWVLPPERPPPWIEIECNLLSIIVAIYALSSKIASKSQFINLNVYLNSESCI